MASMTGADGCVIGGVDAHADCHVVAALDARGGLLGTRAFATTAAGYRDALEWLECFGAVRVVGVESTGAYAAGLARYLRRREVAVVEVNQPHRHARRRRGKSDPLDAELAARAVLAGDARAVAKTTDGIVEAIRQLRVARESAIKARSAAMGQLTGLLVSAPAALREQLAVRASARAKATLCARLRPDPAAISDPTHAAKLALRSLARRIQMLEREITELDHHLGPLVSTAAPRTTKLLAVSTGHAGQLLVSAGQNIERLHSEAAFAALCGTSPIPASSGRTTRHRLNYGGDRHANRALYMIAVCRLRYCQRTRAYAKRRSTEGKTKPEIIRCLKRYIAREIYHTLHADLTDLATPTHP
jgi:transposase